MTSFTIHKFPLEICDEQTIDMPVNARILSVQIQHNTIAMWAMVDLDKTETEQRHFVIYGTGHPLGRPQIVQNFIGTVQIYEGRFVWHIFEHVKNSSPMIVRKFID